MRMDLIKNMEQTVSCSISMHRLISKLERMTHPPLRHCILSGNYYEIKPQGTPVTYHYIARLIRKLPAIFSIILMRGNKMNWIQIMNSTVDYIEANLTKKLYVCQIAEKGYYSSFHFQRMFTMIAGVTVADYVRRRRLTLAAQDLFNGEKVIDVAMRYDYETPEAFTRAFKRLYDITPKDVKNCGVHLVAYPRLSFQISIKGEGYMNYKLVEHPSFEVIGVKCTITTKFGENKKQVVSFWRETETNGTKSKLCNIIGPLGLLGICLHFDSEMSTFEYMIAVEAGNNEEAGYVKEVIPAATYAVFESIGPMPAAIQSVIDRIYNEWFPSTSFEHAGTPELEVYYPGNPQDQNYRSEVWIQIKKQ
jgi:AraC family transcriptional regulator